MLDGDPDLADLHSDDRFRAIVTGSERARASATAALPTDPLIRQPEQPPAQAVLGLLHGRNETAEDVLDRWSTAHRALIVAPRSTQPFGMWAVGWDDPQRAEADVRHAVEVASSRVDLVGLPLLTTGFSQGAGLAIVLAAKRLPRVAGFIAVAPSAGWAQDLLGSDPLSVD